MMLCAIFCCATVMLQWVLKRSCAEVERDLKNQDIQACFKSGFRISAMKQLANYLLSVPVSQTLDTQTLTLLRLVGKVVTLRSFKCQKQEKTFLYMV